MKLRVVIRSITISGNACVQPLVETEGVTTNIGCCSSPGAIQIDFPQWFSLIDGAKKAGTCDRLNKNET